MSLPSFEVAHDTTGLLLELLGNPDKHVVLTEKEIHVEIHPRNEGPLALFKEAPILRFESVRAALASRPPGDVFSGSVDIDLGSLRVIYPPLSPEDSVRILATVHDRVLGADAQARLHFRVDRITALSDREIEVSGAFEFRERVFPIRCRLARVGEEVRFRASFTVRQSEFGIEPLSALGGAIRSKDEVEIRVDVRLDRERLRETARQEFFPAVDIVERAARFGRHVELNLGDPWRKVCSWGCLYCQAGFGIRSKFLSRPVIRRELLRELDSAIHRFPGPEAVVLSGNTEPTLHPEFGEIVRDLIEMRHERWGVWKLICLTNGSQLERDAVVAACDALDETWVKLDCGDDAGFRKLNSPLQPFASVEEQILRIRRLAKPRLQTMLWRDTSHRGLDNTSEAAIEALLEAYRRIAPVAVQLTTPDRLPALKCLEPVSAEFLRQVAERARALAIPSVETYLTSS
jgi:wyosine [tRNA(Phe)-imidazoG37] synthetase (radical SAM superfamily)